MGTRRNGLFLIFALKHRFWVLVITVSISRFKCDPTIYVLGKNEKNIKKIHFRIFNFYTLKNYITGVDIVGDSGVMGTGAAVIGRGPVGMDYRGGQGGVVGSGSGIVDNALSVSEHTITGGNTYYNSTFLVIMQTRSCLYPQAPPFIW